MIYFFDTIDGDAVFRDDYGLDLRDAEEMRHQTCLLLRDLMQDDAPVCGARRVACDVRNREGRVVFSASLALSGEPL